MTTQADLSELTTRAIATRALAAIERLEQSMTENTANLTADLQGLRDDVTTEIRQLADRSATVDSLTQQLAAAQQQVSEIQAQAGADRAAKDEALAQLQAAAATVAELRAQLQADDQPALADNGDAEPAPAPADPGADPAPAPANPAEDPAPVESAPVDPSAGAGDAGEVIPAEPAPGDATTVPADAPVDDNAPVDDTAPAVPTTEDLANGGSGTADAPLVPGDDENAPLA